MMQMQLSRPTGKRRAQALVEFSLTALVFLLLLVMIIEIARILQAYITVQHAARMGARYAVTGQWLEKYGSNPLAGWNPSSTNPLMHIPPCWPRFPDDPTGGGTPPGLPYYEPYRNARTCSIEEVTIIAMAGLNLNPLALPGQPNYYQVVVSGVGDPVNPSNTFQRGFAAGDPILISHPEYAIYTQQTIPYSAYGYPTPSGTSALIRGFGGKPQQKVVVQIEYRVPIVTPILSAIAPSVRVTGTAIMTNESFGSTGLQREAILPPELPPVPTLGSPTPPDLVVTNIAFVTPPPPNPVAGSIVPMQVTVSNQGQVNAVPSTPITVKLYAYPVGSEPPIMAPLSGGQVIGTATINRLLFGETATLSVNAIFPVTGEFAVYGWIDTEDVVNEAGTGSEANPIRESNNVYKMETTVTIEASSDLAVVSKTVSNNTPSPGSQITYTVVVRNNGPTAATGVEVNENMPAAGLTYVSSTASIGSYDPATRKWTIGTLAAGQSATLQLTVSVNSGTDGQILTNTATITNTAPGQPDPVPSNNSSAPLSIAVGGVDLRVQKTVSNNRPNLNEQTTYTITVTNLSANTATGISVSDALPSAVSFVSASPECSNAGGTVTCNLASLAGGASYNFTITVQLIDPAGGNPITNTASLAAVTQSDPNPANNQGSVDITIPSVDLRVTKTVDNNTPPAGGQVNFTIRVTNPSLDTTATNVIVNDLLPSGLTYVSSSTSPSGTTYNSATGVWTVGTLGPSQTATLLIRANVASGLAGGTVINNTATATAYQFDPNTTNNTSVAPLTITNVADLNLTVVETSGIYSADRNGTVRYRFTITNQGPNPATNVRVTVGVTPAGSLTYSTHTADSGTSYASGTGIWTIGNLAVGATKTLTITYTVNANPGTGIGIGGTSLRNEVDPDPTDDTAVIGLFVRLFINAGNQNNSSCQGNVVWNGITWIQNQPYTPGSWGYSGVVTLKNGYTSPVIDAPTGGYTGDASGRQKLFSCSVEARTFNYIFDNLPPGRWRITLGFNEYYWTQTDRRVVRVDTIIGGVRTNLVNNIDLVAVAKPNDPTTPKDGKNVYIYLQYNNIVIGPSGSLTLNFSRVANRDNATVSAIGLEYLGP